MISRTAIVDIKAAISSGVNLTPEEIIRLNALGLRYERTKAGADLRIMPRLAWLGDVVFREPTIGHEIWMKEAADIFDLTKPETLVKVRAFCLATAPEDLPDVGAGRDKLREAVMRFCRERIAFFTLGQVADALAFAEDGSDPATGEVPAPAPARKDRKAAVPVEGERCYEVGLLRRGVLLKLGSVDDLKKMTVSGLEALLVEEYRSNDEDYAKQLVSSAFADYKRTLDEIVAAHGKEA